MIKFGTGGWRAVIGVDFTLENVKKIAAGVCELMKAEGKTDKPVVIGYDRRFLSDAAAKWIAEVLAANGVKVWFSNRSSPTPLVMFIVKDKHLHYGLEVTASHNPAMYNGIKLFVDEGRDSPVEVTEKLEGIINSIDKVESIDFEAACRSGMVEYMSTPFNGFIDSILAQLDTRVIRDRGLRILFDPMHGSGTYPIMTILFTTRCTVDVINSNKDAYFGGVLPAPGKDQLHNLSENVVSGDYDLGIAVDGDGDRLGIIDSNGEYLDANKILVMLYYYLHEYRGWKGPVIRNLATTHMLDAVAKSFGEECYEVPVGFKYISAKLDEKDAVLGGESSGGLTVRGHILGKDSVYAASIFVEMVCAIKKSPTEFYNELTERYGKFVMVEDNLSFRSEDKPGLYERVMVRKELPDFGKQIARVNYEDGCKVYFDDNSFVICRFSGTEPLLRIFAEAEDSKVASEYIEKMKNMLFCADGAAV